MKFAFWVLFCSTDRNLLKCVATHFDRCSSRQTNRNVAGARTSPYEQNSRICQRSLDGWHWMNSENFLFAFVCVFFMIFLFRLALWLWIAASGWITIFCKAAYIGKHGKYDLFLAFVWRVTMTIWMCTRQVFVHTFHRYTRAMRIAQVTLFRFCFVSEFFFVEHNICLFHFGVYLNFETKCGMKRKKRQEKWTKYRKPRNQCQANEERTLYDLRNMNEYQWQWRRRQRRRRQ